MRPYAGCLLVAAFLLLPFSQVAAQVNPILGPAKVLRYVITPAQIDLGARSVAFDTCFTITLRNLPDSDSRSFVLYTPIVLGEDLQLNSPVEFPDTLKPGDSLQFSLCFQANVPGPRYDSIFFNTDCFNAPVAVHALAVIGYVNATDVDFGEVHVADTETRAVKILNEGTASLKLSPNFSITGSNAFSIQDSLRLPRTILPGDSLLLHIPYIPSKTGLDTATIQWRTDLPTGYENLIKSFSGLRGHGIPPVLNGVQPSDKSAAFEIRLYPNPASSSTISVSLHSLANTNVDIRLTDESGKLLRASKLNTGVQVLDIRTLAPGSYFLTASCSGVSKTVRFEVCR